MPDPAKPEMRFERRMTDAEAMMWNVEKDPWLSSNIGTVTILERPLDFDAFRRRIAYAVAQVPRMRERVAPALARLAPPTWEPDPEFALEYHVRRIGVPGPGSDRQLFDLAGVLMQDPLDRSRPLWQFYAVDGLEGGRGAVIAKLHHTITDGGGGVRLAGMYMELSADAALPPEVDLDELTRKAVQARRVERGTGSGGLPGSILRVGGHAWRRQLGIARRAAGEVALALADPGRVAESGANLAKTARSLRSQIEVGPRSGGSALWRTRSRHRRFDALSMPFGPAKAASAALGGSLNDFFVTGAVLGAVRYHEKLGTRADTFNVTFVVSTHQGGGGAGGNSFTPTKIQVAGGAMEVADRFAAVQHAMARRRGEVIGAGLLGLVAGVANLAPTSLATGVARSQAARVDFATSNVRAADFELYMSGARVLAPYPIGPVAGTAWNLTLMSYNGSLCMGLHVDPVAVAEPDLLRQCLDHSFGELLTAGGAT